MRPIIVRIAAIGLTWLWGTFIACQAQTAIAPNDALTGVAYANGLYMAVGFDATIYPASVGVVYTSTDGTNWSRQTDKLFPMNGVAWGNDTYVTFGSCWGLNSSGLWSYTGYFQSSVDGTNWVRQETGLPWQLNRIAFAAGRFVAVGNRGVILTSSDGLSWNFPSSQTEYDLWDIAYGNGQFVVVGANGAVLTSTNGLAWTNQYAGTISDLPAVAFENGRFVALGHALQSWSFAQMLVSSDGVTWTNTYQDSNYYYLDRLFSANGLYFVPYISTSMLLSTNGADWMIGNFGNAYVREVIYAGGRFLAASYGALLTSSDGVTWNNPAVSNSAPTIISTAWTNEVLVGQSFGLNADAFGNPTPACQWVLNGTNLAGANATWLYFWNATTNQAGEYRLVASNEWGTATSEVTTVIVKLQPPIFLTALSNQTVLADYNLTLSANVQAGPAPSYQWYFNGAAIAGATNGSLYLPAVSPQQAGQYNVVVSNTLGMATSQVATLTVSTTPPQFTTQPANQVVPAGAKVSFNGYAIGAPAPDYYLLFNGTNLALPARYGNTFTILDATTNDAGSYIIIASNVVGMATSRVASLTIRPAEPLEIWQRRNPIPQGNNLLSVTYGSGQYVAVGEQGAIVTSTDATNWVVQRLRTDVPLTKVAFGDGQFIAVGDSGNILGSLDGQTWNLRRFEDANLWFHAVTYGNGRFIAVGYSLSSSTGTIWTSTNGWSWTPCAVVGPNREFTEVAWGNGRFVAVGGSGYVGVSLSGVDWDIQNLGDYGRTTRITFGKGRFVAIGNNGLAAVSGDGYSWTARTFGSIRRFLGVAYGNDLFVTVGTRGTIYSSPDGMTWTQRDSTTPDRLEGVAYANNLFVAAGENGTTLTSSDGVTWANQTRGTVRDLDGMTVGDGLLVIAGKYGTILTSADGQHFTLQTTGITNDIHGITYANGQYVAVGEQGTILTSSNALQWTAQNSGDTNIALKRAAWGNGLWVAVGTRGVILTSPNAVDWTAAVSPVSDDLNEVAYGNGRFVIVGDHTPRNATIVTSTDGTHWSNQLYYTGKNMRGITFANRLFMATGNDGVIAVSSDGFSWTSRYSGVNYNGSNLRSAWYTNGLWIMVGNDGLILTSTDTQTWKVRAANSIENLHGVAFFNGSFVTIGNRGNIFQSGRLFGPSLAAPVFYPQTGFALTIQGHLGYVQRLQASSNLRDWTDILTLPDTQAATNYVDAEAQLHPNRFYRLISP